MKAATDEADLVARQSARRWAVFVSATIGYSLYYVCRLSLSALKAPLVQEGILTETQLGAVGSGLFYAYAVGKCVNGFVADGANLRRMVMAGLVASAAINLMLGLAPAFTFFAALWLVNGWMQSMGAPACIVSLARWFEKKDRGTYYGFWSASHNLGEGLTFIAVAVVSSHWGWRWGFWGAAAAGLGGVLLLWIWFYERPPETSLCAATARHTVPFRWSVIRNPTVWAIATASALMYVARYAVNSWGMFFLEVGKGYSRIEAGTMISMGAVCGVLGTIASGWVSDRWFPANRFLPAVIAGVIKVLALGLFVQTMWRGYWLDAACMCGFGISIGALICYLGGLLAIDSVPADSAGAALGIVGIASYIGAGLQDLMSGLLIERFKSTIGGAAHYNFAPVSIMWVGAALLSVLVTTGIWFASRRGYLSSSA